MDARFTVHLAKNGCKERFTVGIYDAQVNGLHFPSSGPKGRSKGCTANFCYSNGLRAQKRGGGKEAKSWCNKRAGEGCGCQWVPQKRPYAKYSQTRKDKGNYGYT